jgi:predicted outer membrane protein
MDQLQMAKQMMQMYKLAFDNNYNMIMGAYEQNKLMLNAMLSQASDFPVEVKNAIDEWLKTYKKGCEELKEMIDQGYRMVEKTMSDVTPKS